MPVATANGVHVKVRTHRPAVRYASGVDGVTSEAPTDFEPPDGSGWPPLGPTIGTVRLAVIAAEFSDMPHTRTLDQIREDYFGANNSLAAYYREVSYGKLSVTGDVFGWYTLQDPEAHYGKNCLSINDANCDGQDVSWEIAQDVISQAEKDVNFANYDYFAFVHSGNGQESSKAPDDVWSATYVSGVSIETNSRTLIAFSIVAEEEAKSHIPLGVYCAEFGHLLGVPDMFDTATGRTEMGPWELEEVGTWNGQPPGSSPAEMSSWDRLKLGWLPEADEEVITQSAAAMTLLNPLESPEGLRAVKITATSSYFLLEVRRPIGFDSALPSFGVIAYQIINSDAAAPFHKVAGLTTAFEPGYLYTSNGSNGPDVSFKVFDSFTNGSYLVGFGPTSFTPGVALTIKLDPTAANVTVIVNNQTYSTDANGTVDIFNLNGPDTFNVTVPAIAPLGVGARGVFDHWSNGGNSTSLSLPSGADEIVAFYNVEYYVGVNTPFGSPSGTGWYNPGATATVALPQIVNDTQPGIRHTFIGWQGALNETSNLLSFEVETPTNLTATWGTQYYVDIDTGGHANSMGSGWYDAGSNVTYSVSPPDPSNGSWYLFQGWSGDCTGSNLSGTLDVTRPMRLAAQWNVLDWMTIVFVDANAQPIIPTRILLGQLVAPNGTAILLDQSTASGLWLANGTYLISGVTTFGVDVSVAGQSFTTTPNGSAIIYLDLYDMTFRIHDMITSIPISGASVTITLPDGSTESNVTGSDGTVIFEQLPVASYAYETTGNWLVQFTGNTTTGLDGSMKLDVGMIYLPSLAAVILSAFAIVIVSVLLTRRRKHTKKEILQEWYSYR